MKSFCSWRLLWLSKLPPGVSRTKSTWNAVANSVDLFAPCSDWWKRPSPWWTYGSSSRWSRSSLVDAAARTSTKLVWHLQKNGLLEKIGISWITTSALLSWKRFTSRRRSCRRWKIIALNSSKMCWSFARKSDSSFTLDDAHVNADKSASTEAGRSCLHRFVFWTSKRCVRSCLAACSISALTLLYTHTHTYISIYLSIYIYSETTYLAVCPLQSYLYISGVPANLSQNKPCKSKTTCI